MYYNGNPKHFDPNYQPNYTRSSSDRNGNTNTDDTKTAQISKNAQKADKSFVAFLKNKNPFLS